MSRGHALIVDDSSTARIILARLLERADITTKGVASAEEALSRVQHEQFDIIFLDHLLPGMNGFQALEALKAQPGTRDIPVFMYTSQNAERYLQEAKARGAAGVIGKQVDRDQLFQTLEAILSGQARVPDYEPGYVTHSPQSMLDQSLTRRVTGRLATLEIAYEEANDELRNLRQSMARMEAMYQEGIDTRHRRLKWLWLATLVFFTAITVALGFQISNLAGVIEGVNSQLGLMREIVGSLVDLIGR